MMSRAGLILLLAIVLIVFLVFAPLPGCDGSKWGRFEGRVSATWDDDGRNMTLVEEFAFHDSDGKKWTAPAGSVVNGASIPSIFWPILGGPFEGKFRNASVVHDVYCDTKTEASEDVHKMFYLACRCGGVRENKAKAMYYAVLHFGLSWERVVATAAPSIEGPVVFSLRIINPDAPSAEQAQSILEFFEQHNPAVDEIPNLEIPNLP